MFKTWSDQVGGMTRSVKGLRSHEDRGNEIKYKSSTFWKESHMPNIYVEGPVIKDLSLIHI